MSTEIPIVEERLQEIETMPREAMIAKSEARQLCAAYRALSANRACVPENFPQFEELRRLADEYAAACSRGDETWKEVRFQRLADGIRYMLSAVPAPAGERVSVPVDAIRWLLGECANPETGEWFERPEGGKAFWWRADVRKWLSAQLAAEPSAQPDNFKDAAQRFIDSQQPLGAEFQKVLRDNLWELYERGGKADEPSANPADDRVIRRLGFGLSPTITFDKPVELKGGVTYDVTIAPRIAQPADAKAGEGMCGCGDPDCHIAIGRPHIDLAGDHNK